MTNQFIPRRFEEKWIKRWQEEETYRTGNFEPGKKKAYILDMFPYPSGVGLHVGHPRGYTASDVMARYLRMNGRQVLHPIGWDAFGLPAENAAIKLKKTPQEIVPKNIANFKRQLYMLGFSYDWSRELTTTDPNYYRITQWLFIQFFKMGLLYKKMTPVYFCPQCKTGLAEEEVFANGTHERCGAKITQKELPQWIFKITDYADSLLATLKDLEWPKGILEMQKNWIGKKTGIDITYPVVNSPSEKKIIDRVTCFTTRPDTNFGATFVVLAPEHRLVKEIIEGRIKVADKIREAVGKYRERSLAKTNVERMSEGRKKTGVFTGLYAINGLNNRLLPIWVGDFVLAGVGTGAVVGVPGHDKRDFEFAKKFGLEVIRVVIGEDGDSSPITDERQVQEEAGKMINSQFLDGMDIHRATEKISEYIEKKGWGKRRVNYHLHDWVFSRQRYWGEPIPMVYCPYCAKKRRHWWNAGGKGEFFKKHKEKPKLRSQVDKRWQKVGASLYGWFPLEEEDLPLKLPQISHYQPTKSGQSPLDNVVDWKKTTCPHCKRTEAVRETDTMPNWAGSSWYFLAFPFWRKDGKQSKMKLTKLWQTKIKNHVREWLPVDWYFGGAEHAVLHLLYSRFWIHALNDLGLVNFREPFIRLRNVGMVLAEDHRKMSKSWGNVINPDDVVRKYGADTLRVYEMFMAPFSQEITWSRSTLQGSHRFLRRIWQLYNQSAYVAKRADKGSQEIDTELKRTILKVGKDITGVKFNTAIAAMMKFINYWERQKVKLSLNEAKMFLKILSPFAPFIAEEIWRTVLKEKKSIYFSSWPQVSGDFLSREKVTIPVQVNGKLRLTLSLLPHQLSENQVVAEALRSPKIRKYLKGKQYRPIYVPGKILNFVI